MPEGPSIVILKEETAAFKGRKIVAATGNASIDMDRISGKTIRDLKSWGKHFLICLDDCTIRIHFLLFGTYRINERKEALTRLRLSFKTGELNFYTCSVQLIEAPLDEVYDWQADVMNADFSTRKAAAKLKAAPEMLVCDALLDQHIFAGVGNIIKNEVLFRIYVHPLSKVGHLPVQQRRALIKEAVQYSFDFLRWKQAYELKKHWLVHTKKTCPRCNIPLVKEHLGKTNRRTFYCANCQVLY